MQIGVRQQTLSLGLNYLEYFSVLGFPSEVLPDGIDNLDLLILADILREYANIFRKNDFVVEAVFDNVADILEGKV